MNNTATETLLLQRDKLIAEKNSVVIRLDEQINNIESAIEKLEGKKVWETEQAFVYDDENPDYIRQSAEEI